MAQKSRNSRYGKAFSQFENLMTEGENDAFENEKPTSDLEEGEVEEERVYRMMKRNSRTFRKPDTSDIKVETQ